MSKELPFFKFTPTEWLVGKISFQPLEVQGAFIQCCCMYWKQCGILDVKDVKSKIGFENYCKLVHNCFLKSENGKVSIKFLKNQIFENEIVEINKSKNKKAPYTHWNWKGGITPNNEKIRNSSKMQKWRVKVFMRDDYTCVKCKKRGGNLEAHHIKEFSKYPELRFELSNGMTVCKSCHIKIHSKNE